MAANLECEIIEGEATIPGMPNPWQVQMRFFDADHNLVRSWAVDAPSELVAKTIETALTIMTDNNYNFVYNEVTVR
jgi:hypothetical protein